MAKKYIGITELTNIYAEEMNITKKDSELQVKGFINVLKNILLDPTNSGLQLIDFITIENIVKAERLGRNIRTGESVVVPAKNGLKIKVGNKFNDELNA